MQLPWNRAFGLSTLVGTALVPGQAMLLPDLVQHHCGECHRGADADGHFDVEAIFAPSATDTERQRAALALARIRSRTMPPVDADAERPDAAARAALSIAFADVLPADPEARTVTMRRLSRVEYANTIRDLCGVAFAAADLLPEDPRAYGTDNVGDVMTTSPLVFEKYFDAAGVVATAMLAAPTACAQAFRDADPVTTTLAPFLARAFRRPVTASEVQERADLFASLLASGTTVATARAAVLRSILAAPQFLFRVELGATADPTALTPHELATRLAYLTTASMPDAELTALADADALAAPECLRAQAVRLAAAAAARPLAEGFAAQWLRFADVLTASADFRRYPEIWNHRLRPALFEEAVQFFAAMVRDDASVLTLLDADHTYLDETLSKLYGIGDVHGNEFVRVTLPDRRRGGILGMGAMLMVTSYPLRTSPVRRGRWILEQLLDEPPPPPPANAGVLPADDQQDDGFSLRARLERHRREPSCANCHAQMDPLGFALENWDVLGRWRNEVHGQPIDCKAELPDGTQLDGPIALKDALLARRHDFVRAMVKQLLIRAIGRPLVAADERELLRIVDDVIAHEYRFSAVLGAVVTSPLFCRRIPGGDR